MKAIAPFVAEGQVGPSLTRTGHIVRMLNRDAFDAHLLKYQVGDLVDLEVRPHEETRRIQAQRYLFGVVYALIEKDTGQSKESIHEAMKQRFLAKSVTQFTNYQTGEILETQVIESSTIQTISAYGAFIENVRLWAQEWLGLYAPDPDPDYRLKRRRKANEPSEVAP